jgi:two-component system, OmpR family, response regulator ChvI
LKDNNNTSNGDNGNSTFTSSNSDNRQSTYKILLVDDEPDILYTFQKGLERNGFEVDAFTDPGEALSHFKNKNAVTNNSTTNIRTTHTFTKSNYYFDLLLLDFKMPKMNGFELYTEMKKVVQDNKITKVCFITAFEEYYNTLKKEFPALDVRCFIKKPIEVQDLVREIKAELNK